MGFWNESRALLTMLKIEPTKGTIEHRPEPLYVETAQTRGEGEDHLKECENLIHTSELIRGYRRRRFTEGPVPKPSYIVVTSYKWVWRGLDPELKYPLPIYEALLKGRITTSREDGERSGPEPRIIHLEPTESQEQPGSSLHQTCTNSA